jgi:hypothetical protein
MSNDIFISYAHIDNQPLGDTSGWVDQLFKHLQVRLSQVLGAEPSIWWDKRLQGDQYFAGEIGDRVGETLLLTPVVTPRYAKSNWCRGELKEFCERAHGNVQMRNNSRVFKIVKTPVAEEQLPEELHGMLGYVFYEVDEKNRPREFRQVLGHDRDQRYWDKLDDLAWDIKDAIEKLNAQSDAQAAEAAEVAKVVEALPLAKKVYLAETTPELNVERDRIKRELQQNNYYVLPDSPLPRNQNLEGTVREYLSRCVLSIHLIGARFEQTVETGKTSDMPHEGAPPPPVVQLQAEIAAERANSGEEFSRLIWLPPGLQTEDSRQQSFIKELQDNIGVGSELLQTSLEDLKLRIIQKLNSAPKAGPSDQQSSVYLIYDNRDAGEVKPIDDFLYNHGFDVIPPIFEGDSAELAQYHRDSLLNCEAALIYYGSANQMWLRSKIWDLQKAPGWGRPSPVLAAVYVGGEQTTEKERFRTREVPLIIHNFKEFSPDKLQPFLDAMQTGNGGQKS